MKTDLLLLTLLYAVALAAFVGAINARGPARVTLSYFLAILTLCAAVFHTSQYLAAPNPADATVVPAPPEPVKPLTPPPPPPPDTQGLSQSKKDLELAEAKNDLKGVVEAGQRVVRNLASLNLGSVSDVSDEEYEGLQNRAVGYLGEARKVKERYAGVSSKTPQALNEANETVGKGVENALTAASNAERFFKSENDDEEKERLGSFRRNSAAASASFKKANSLLGSSDGD